MNTYYVARQGSTLGPYSSEEIIDLVRQQQLDLSDLCAEPGAEDWMPVQELVGTDHLLGPQIVRQTVSINRGLPSHVFVPTGKGYRSGSGSKVSSGAFKLVGTIGIVVGVLSLGTPLVGGTLLAIGLILFLVGRFNA